MTREEAKKTIESLIPNSGSESYNKALSKANKAWKMRINKIYDDFESRTCESCKHKTKNGRYQATNKTIYECKLKVSFGTNPTRAIKLTDGCNNWEAKEK